MRVTEARWLLALDFGGTKHSAAVLAQGAQVWDGLRRVNSPPGADARADVEIMLGLARKLLAGRQPAAVGVSFGGPVDAARGLVLLSHHVPGWENMPLRDQLRQEFGAPVSVDNDANVAALGEQRFGAGRGTASLLYVTVSTGVGGGWVLGGRIYHGANSAAGEIGHIIVQPDGPRCICGRRGCVEALAAGPNLARRAGERLLSEAGAGALLRELASGNWEEVTAEQVVRAAEAGDELAQGVLDEAARALGMGIAAAITLMNPQRVVLGGGVTKSGERWWQVVRETARAHALSMPPLTVDIVPAALGDDAPLWGAAALAEAELALRVVIVHLTPPEAVAARDAIVAVYRAAFGTPPYHEDETAVAGFAERFLGHARHAGFRCCAAREEESGEFVGFAYGYTVRPGQWWRDTVAADLGPEQVEQWLSDCFELVELAVRPSFQGRGIGGRLHDAILEELPHRTAMLSTVQADTPAMRLYRKRGWVRLLEGFDFPGTPDPYDVLGLDLRHRPRSVAGGLRS